MGLRAWLRFAQLLCPGRRASPEDRRLAAGDAAQGSHPPFCTPAPPAKLNQLGP